MRDMQGPSYRSRSTILWLAVAVATVAVLFVSSTRSPVSTATVTWSQNPLKIVISPGETTQRTVILRSSALLTNARIEVMPEIASLIAISPTAPESIAADQPFAVTLLVSPRTNETLSTIRGTVHVRIGADSLAQPLSVVVYMSKGVYTASNLIGTTYPPLPPDIVKESSSTIGEKTPATHELAWVTTPNGPMLWFSRRAGMFRREVTWTITDVLMIPRLEREQFLIFGLCGAVRSGVARPTDQSALALDPELIAIVLATDEPVRTHLERAWRANPRRPPKLPHLWPPQTPSPWGDRLST